MASDLEIGEGIILDHKRAVCVYGGSFSVGQDYAETLNAYQQDLGSDVQVYSLVAPTAVSYYLPEEYANYTASETENIDNINSYLKDTVRMAYDHGFVETIFGRRRYIPELKASNKMMRSFGERVAMNSPIQGSAADIIKIAMVNTRNAKSEAKRS